MSVIISPSLLAANFTRLGEEIKKLEKNGINCLHIDVMDGNFVPNISFGPDQIKMLRPVSKMEFDVHMMVVEPDRYIKNFVEAGADSITVHAEATRHLHRTIQLIKSFGKKVGVALNPATPLEELTYVLNLLDRVLIMTVNPGYGGKKFIDDMLDKVKQIASIKKENKYNFEVQVDGGINKDNLINIVKAGATDIVMGSATFKGDTEQNIKDFQKIIGEGIK